MSKDDPGQLRAPVRPAAKGGRPRPKAVAIAAEKKAVLGRSALTNDPVARESAASSLEHWKRLARQALGKR
jgi:hypothetical protein